MQTRLSTEFRGTRAGEEGAAIVQRCVHCGFCTATCPTYQLLGDELDGPRGRIHLIRQALEGEAVSASTRLHLDRCLTCRACETACPSGVQYGRLLDIGREVVERKAPRSAARKLGRRLLADFLAGPLFAPALRVARFAEPVLPVRWRPGLGAAPARSTAAGLSSRYEEVAAAQSAGAVAPRRMLRVRGCVQPALAPGIDAAAERLFTRCGIAFFTAPDAGCCGSIHHHLALPDGALARARANVDAWWPFVESGLEAIVVTASGCGTQLREYGHLLREDPRYASRAARISAMARDPAEVLAREVPRLAAMAAPLRVPERIAFHSPCSLQHGLRINGVVESILRALGAQLVPVADAQACCGSAGTYSLLQPQLSGRLARAKVMALEAGQPERVLTANIGCLRQIAQASRLPVQHWLEWVEGRLTAPES